jgi:hypothetical protein
MTGGEPLDAGRQAGHRVRSGRSRHQTRHDAHLLRGRGGHRRCRLARRHQDDGFVFWNRAGGKCPPDELTRLDAVDAGAQDGGSVLAELRERTVQ